MNRRRLRPLYESVAKEVLGRQPNGHAGLWFDKFFDYWPTDHCSTGSRIWKSDSKSKFEWIRTVANGKPVGSQKQIEEYAHRVVRLVRKCGGQFYVFESESRFVTGLGHNNPVENGFAWHSTLGTPYLPGSSVKGVVRAWVTTDEEPRPSREIVARTFGPDNALGSARHVGTVCFLDAIPVAPVKLDADVLTPHYANWTSEDPPGDWCSPTPIPFLTTAAGTCFLFGVVPRSNDTGSDLKSVLGWLESALKWSGAGGKTAVGYGQFRRNDEVTRSLDDWLEGEKRKRIQEREQEEAMKTPEGRWRLKLKGLSETKLLDKVRINLEKELIEDEEERQAFAEAVWATGFPKNWRRGRKTDPSTNVGAKKLKQRARLVQEARTHSQL